MYHPVFHEINRSHAISIGEINMTRVMCINEVNQSRRLFFNEINLTRMMFESRLKQLEQKVSENTTDLSVANKKIDLLQSFCIANGLEIPFWNSAYPPSAAVSSMEALSASTAVACANFALEPVRDAYSDAEYADIANSISDYGDAYGSGGNYTEAEYNDAYGQNVNTYGQDNYGYNIYNHDLDFIPVPYYDEADASDAETSDAETSDYEDEDESLYDP